MPQVFVQPADLTQDSFVIRGKEAHHLIRVLRKKTNDEIALFDGQGHQFRGKLTRLDGDRNEIHGVILEKKSSSRRTHKLILYQGLPRGAKFDYVIEKATELGVDGIVPFLSQKNPIQSPSETKVPRWEQVAQAAAKQCNRPEVPSVEGPRPLEDLAPHLKNGLSLLLWEKEKTRQLKSLLQEKLSFHNLINIIIGPEAGFTAGEAEFLGSCGAIPVTLGQRILRTETAGLAVLSIINYELGLF